MVIITKTAKNVGYSFSNRKRRGEDNVNEEASRTKGARVKASFALLARATDCDSGEGIDLSTNRVPIPINYEDAVNDRIWGQRWQDAIALKLDQFQANGIWNVIRRLTDVNIVTSRWVMDVKYQVGGRIERFKARFVARGFTQIYGIDFDETFAPIMQIDLLRIFLYLMALEDMEAEQVDVNNAFIESIFEEDIYINSFPGLTLPRRCMLKLNRSLYKLKQSARQWYRKYTKVLEEKKALSNAFPTRACLSVIAAQSSACTLTT